MAIDSSTLAQPEEIEIESDGMVDLVEEIRLRTWARKNYKSVVDRDDCWHPVILDEMENIDAERVRV